MIDLLFWMVGAPVWLMGGSFSAKKALAMAEAHYLKLSEEAHRKDASVMLQDKMDPDDWIGASLFAGGAFVAFPVLVVGWALNKLAGPLKRPLRSFFMPPVQKEFEYHVAVMENQKALVLSTARVYQDVLKWEPEDHPDRVAMVNQLQAQITDQLNELMRMADPKRAFDGDYLEEARMEVKELTAGGL